MLLNLFFAGFEFYSGSSVELLSANFCELLYSSFSVFDMKSICFAPGILGKFEGLIASLLELSRLPVKI